MTYGSDIIEPDFMQEIALLKAEIAKLRAALEQIAREHRWPSHFTVTDCRRIARKALANEQKP